MGALPFILDIQMTDYEFVDDVDPAVIEALTARVGDLSTTIQAAERQRRREIREMGQVAGLPKLAAKLIDEGVSPTAAFRRLLAAKKRREAARKIEVAKGWDNAIAGLNGEPKAASPDPHGWATAIAKAGLKANG